MPSSSGSSQLRDWTQVSPIAGGFFTIWPTREAQEYWSRLPIPSPGDLPAQELNLSLQVDSLPAKLVQLNVVEWRNIFYLLFYMTKRWILYSFVIWRVCVFICLNNTILTLLFFFSKIMIAEEMEEKFIYIYIYVCVCIYIYIYTETVHWYNWRERMA